MKEIRELEFYTKELEDVYSSILHSKINGIEEWHAMTGNYTWKLYPFYYNKIPHVNSDAEPSGFYYRYYRSKFKYYFAVYKPSLYK